MRKTVLMMVLAVVAMASSALAADKNGLYIGGGLGWATLDVKGDSTDLGHLDFNEDDLGYKVFAGVRVLKFVAVEGGYVDFGTPSASFGSGSTVLDTEIKLDGWDLYGVGILPLGLFDVYAKVGYFWWDADIRAAIEGESERESDSGSDMAYGIGAALWLSQISIRAEFELFDVAEAESVYMISINAAFTF